MRVVLGLLLVLSWLHGTAARAQPTAAGSPRAHEAAIDAFLSASIEGRLALYRELHAHPELSLQEKQTASAVARDLSASGYRVESGVGGYGVVGVLDNGAGPTVLVRGDMDALPVKEETGLPFASRARGKPESGAVGPVMHACGHDLHVVNLLTVADLLAHQRKAWSGTLLIVAQPAEELGEGASRMIAAGLFERFPKPSYALALHVDDAIVAGHVGVVSGWAAANVDSVDVTIFGRGGHGARPEQTVDPIVASAHFVTALQTLVSRRNDPRKPAVVTVGSIHGGTKHNVIPDDVHMQITVRSFSDEERKLLLDGISQIAQGTCVQFGCPKPPLVVVKDNYTPAVYNDPALADSAIRTFSGALGPQAVERPEPTLGGEDFGRFGRALHIPSLQFRLGAVPEAAYRASRQPGAQPLPTLHSSHFAPDAKITLQTGVRAMTALVLSLMPPRSEAPP
ncbi:MAG: M20 family metallopeptidase [Polyangiales bacterium]